MEKAQESHLGRLSLSFVTEGHSRWRQMCPPSPALVNTDGVTLGNSPNLFRWQSPEKAQINQGGGFQGSLLQILVRK